MNIYVIDSGVRSSHDDFGGRVVAVGDFYTGNPGSSDVSDCAVSGGHGTINASLAAGSSYGVAKGATIYALKAAGGSPCQGDDDAIVRAVNWVTANGVQPAVVNLSFRSSSSSVHNAILNSIAAGFPYTLSAGCSGDVNDIWGGELASEALIVGGTDQYDQASEGDYGSGLALYAPAIGIKAAGNVSDSYQYTADLSCADSYAAPHVAGAVAVFLQLYPDANPEQIRRVMIHGATEGALSGLSGATPNLLLYSPPVVPAVSGDGIYAAGLNLYTGWEVTSQDTRFHLVYQGDGNLVLYMDTGGGLSALWSAESNDSNPGVVSMQGDGNLVVYNGSMVPTWQAGTGGYWGSVLAVQNDGNAVIYDWTGLPLWSTGTGGHGMLARTFLVKRPPQFFAAVHPKHRPIL